MIGVDWLLSIAEGVGGYLGIFVVSVIGNLIPFMPIPYLVAVYLYSAYMPGSNPLLVGLVSGLGGGVGKLAVYYMSRGASLLLSEEKRREMERLRQVIGNYGALAVFIFAATPSPDDVVIAVLGLMGYDPLKFFISVTAGKTLISILTAYTGRIVVEAVGEENFWLSLGVSIVLFIVTMILMTLINWNRIFEVLGERGWRGIYEDMRRKGIVKFLFSRDGKHGSDKEH